MVFRKKPIEVEAFRLTSELLNSVPRFHPVDHSSENPVVFNQGDYATINTLEGVIRADIGDWIITGVKGEKYPCKSDIFEATYEAA